MNQRNDRSFGESAKKETDRPAAIASLVAQLLSALDWSELLVVELA